MNKNGLIKISKRVAIISGTLTVVFTLFLLFNYIQISKIDPIEKETISLLVNKVSSEPDNEELINEIRYLDLLSRKAYFTGIWQIYSLSLLTLISVVVFIISVQYYKKIKKHIKVPQIDGSSNQKQVKVVQVSLLSLAFTIVFISLISAYFSVDYLSLYEAKKLTKKENEIDDIERVSIVSSKDFSEDTIIDTIAKESVKEDSAIEAKQLTPFNASAIRNNHNTFRGPWGHGISYSKNLPTNWDGASGKNIIWKTEIPVHGYNSPVLWEDKLFLSGANEKRRVVYCFDRHTGEILWEQDADNIPGSPSTPPRTTDDTGLAAATLAVDNQQVYAIFGTGDIIAFDFEGNRIWARNLGVPQNHYGHSSSLITWDNKVFVQYDTMEGSKALALDTKTGNIVWETPRTDDISWSSPILAKVNNEFQLIVLSLPGLSGYNIKTGEQLWYVECMSGEVGTSPAYGDGLIYAGNEYAKFVAVDPNTGEIVWEDNYYLPEVSSPVYYQGLVYIATTYALVSCFDAKTGEFIWEYDTGRGFYSSPIIADGKLYVFDMDGVCYIFNPGKEPNLISSPNLGEEVYASPVFDNGKLYIRGNNNLYCIGE